MNKHEIFPSLQLEGLWAMGSGELSASAGRGAALQGLQGGTWKTLPSPLLEKSHVFMPGATFPDSHLSTPPVPKDQTKRALFPQHIPVPLEQPQPPVLHRPGLCRAGAGWIYELVE